MRWSLFDIVSDWRLETLKIDDTDAFSCECCRTFYVNEFGQIIVDKISTLSKNRCLFEMS